MRNTELSTLSSEHEPPSTHSNHHEKFDERFWRPNKLNLRLGLRNPQIHFLGKKSDKMIVWKLGARVWVTGFSFLRVPFFKEFQST